MESTSCAKERLNTAREPFDHSIQAGGGGFVYRGMHCWQQFSAAESTVVDFVWKLEVCQLQPAVILSSTPAPQPLGGKSNVTLLAQTDGKTASAPRTEEKIPPPRHCPECECPYCGITTCRDGREPVRVVHRMEAASDSTEEGRCSCDCLCKFHCLGGEE